MPGGDGTGTERENIEKMKIQIISEGSISLDYLKKRWGLSIVLAQRP